MFDIAFSELLLIGLVALVVIGPERLPKVARTVGTWLGRLNRYVAQVKQDIDRDMELEELRKLQQQMKDSAQKYEILAQETAQDVKKEVSQVDKVMQAMAATDGGLALQEYEKIKAEKLAEAGADSDAKSGAVADASATEALSDDLSPEAKQVVAPEAPATETASTTQEPAPFQSGLDDDITADEMTPAAGNKTEHKT